MISRDKERKKSILPVGSQSESGHRTGTLSRRPQQKLRKTALVLPGQVPTDSTFEEETLQAAPTRRGPGRPKGSLNRRGPGRPKGSTNKIAKRGPGRPRKTETPVKRGPGRPRKIEASGNSGRGPGRPRKILVETIEKRAYNKTAQGVAKVAITATKRALEAAQNALKKAEAALKAATQVASGSKKIRSVAVSVTPATSQTEQLAQTAGATKRGPGRPKGSKNRRGPGRPKGSVSAKTIKKGPGRPKGSKNKSTSASYSPAKRGPGRPPKKRGPGRPRKYA